MRAPRFRRAAGAAVLCLVPLLASCRGGSAGRGPAGDRGRVYGARRTAEYEAKPPARAAPATTPAQLAFAVTDTSDDRRIGEPEPGDWLMRFPEPGQSFEAYVASDPVGPTARRTEIVLVPIGPFAEREEALLRTVADFTALWFDLPARIAPALPLPDEPDRWRAWKGRRWGQYLTTPFLEQDLPPVLPPTAVALLGITMADLYPDEDWNFVFGQARLRDRVGIYSLARLGPEFLGEARTRETETQELRRSLQVVVHELGHMFGLLHCKDNLCTMNGSNSLPESDRQPLHLCAECLRKLQWRIGFDVLQRYDRLVEFFARAGLHEEASWAHRRAERIREVR